MIAADALDTSNAGVVFVDLRRADQHSMARWQRAKTTLASRFPKLHFVDYRLYLRATEMATGRRTAALRSLRTPKTPNKQELLSPSKQEDIEAVSAATAFANALKQQQIREHPGLSALIADLVRHSYW